MTRFASFWVEHGRIVAPLNVMRFDDSLFRVLGPNLEALGATPELLLDNSDLSRARHQQSMHACLAR